jgi:ABC-type nitrate/sulfonate/bicarbonate transport system substrate-binding protein
MNTFATNGEVINALMHTNIADLANVQIAGWQAFPFAPPMNELALAGSIDIVPEGMIPAASLLAARPAEWIVAARLVYFPILLVARTGSGVTSVQDLRGRVIGTPFGSGAHPPVLETLQEAGLSEADVTLVNLGIPEQIEALKAGRVDVVGTWEPQAAAMEAQGLGTRLASYRHIGFVLLRRQRATQSRQDTVNLLKAFLLAHWYCAAHPDMVRAWFAVDSRFGEDLLQKIAILEPNVSARELTQIELNITPDDIAQATRYSHLMASRGLLPSPVNFADSVDLSYLQQASEELRQDDSRPRISER